MYPRFQVSLSSKLLELENLWRLGTSLGKKSAGLAKRPVTTGRLRFLGGLAAPPHEAPLHAPTLQ